MHASMNANPRQGSPASRLFARLARRDRWPRRWWWPPGDRPALTPDTAKDYTERHREISEAIRFSMLGLIGFSFFCALTLAAPDSVLLTGAGKIPVPFANTDIDFGTFITIGPLLLIGYTLYVHIFIGELLRLPDVPEVDRAVALFNLRGRVPSFLSYLVFYWLAPATVLVFAQRAAPRAAGTWLYFVAAVFLLVLLVLQLRRNPYPRRWARPMLWLLVLAVAMVPARILWWAAEGGPRPFQRPWDLEQADLSKANLIGADLEGARLKRANLQGADLTRAHLRGADFSDADLGGAVLQLADLREANLRGAKLERTDLRFSNMRYAMAGEADFGAALVSAEQLKGLCFDSSTVFAAGTQPADVPARCRGDLAKSGEFRACRLPREPVPCDGSVVAGILAPPDGYVVECLQACDPYYVDRGRSHTLAEIPRELQGSAWIKTTNTGDKNESAEDFLSFGIEPPAYVYVAYDSRVVERGSPPRWLVDGFERTGMKVELNEPDPRQDFVVYRRLYTDSPVVLGGNQAAGADFGGVSGSNYLVAVKRATRPGRRTRRRADRSRREERVHRAHHRLGLVLVHGVAGVGDVHGARARHAASQPREALAREQVVVLAAHEQQAAGDAVDGVAGIAAGAFVQPHRADRGDEGVEVRRRVQVQVAPVRVGEQAPPALGADHRQQVARRVVRRQLPVRADRHHARDLERRIGREPVGDDAAVAEAQHRRLPQPEPRGHRRDVALQALVAQRAITEGGASVAAQVDPDHPHALAQQRHDLGEVVQAAEPAVQHQQRRAGGIAALLDVDRRAVDLQYLPGRVVEGLHAAFLPVGVPCERAKQRRASMIRPICLAAACLCAAACASAGPEAGVQPSDDIQAQCSAQANAAAAGAGEREAAFEQCLERAGWRR